MDVYPNIEFTYIKVYLSGNCWYKKKLLYTRDKSLCKEQMRNFFTIYLFFSFWILSFSKFKQLQWLNQENFTILTTMWVCIYKKKIHDLDYEKPFPLSPSVHLVYKVLFSIWHWIKIFTFLAHYKCRGVLGNLVGSM